MNVASLLKTMLACQSCEARGGRPETAPTAVHCSAHSGASRSESCCVEADALWVCVMYNSSFIYHITLSLAEHPTADLVA